MTKQSNKMKETIKCRFCESTNIIKWCKRKTQNRGLIQRYKCKDCRKYFTIDEGFFRMRNTPQKITLCLDLFYKGVSTRKVQEHLQMFYPANSSWVSIYSWVVKYSKKISKFTDSLKLNASEEVQVDEMEYKTKGQKSWFIDCIDTKTRYMISSEFTKTREQKEIKKVLLNIKKKTGTQIKICTTDGYTAYEKMIKRTWGYDNRKGKHNVIHNKVTQLKGEGFNHKIERMHSSIRQRTKVFRGFGSLDGANAIMKGYEIFYNFIRKHQAIGCCPYEIATDVKLKNPNKWLELINLANLNH